MEKLIFNLSHRNANINLFLVTLTFLISYAFCSVFQTKHDYACYIVMHDT